MTGEQGGFFGLGFLVGLGMGAFTLFLVALWVSTGVEQSLRQDAINHGAAEYYLDENHERQWRWVEQQATAATTQGE